MARIYSKEEVELTLAGMDWQSPDDFMQNDPQNPVLFRAHNTLDPENTRDFGTADKLIHATPVFTVAASLLRGKMNQHYEHIPPRHGFLSIYPCAPDQTFYPDEHLEAVAKGKMVDEGIPLYAITAFHEDKHYETGIPSQTPSLGLYLYRHGGIGKDIQVAPLPENHPLRDILKANQKPSRLPLLGKTDIKSDFRPS
ncbi:MAG TPA: hypothetical protein VGF14_00905 [Alphaproteobacteria bacterium]